MEWIDLQSLGTVAGAAAAVTLVTALLKQLVGVGGRLVILLAFVVSLIVVVIAMPFANWQGFVLDVLNAALVTGVAVGINESVKKQ